MSHQSAATNLSVASKSPQINPSTEAVAAPPTWRVSRRTVLSTAVGGTGILLVGANVDFGVETVPPGANDNNQWEPPPSAPAAAAVDDNEPRRQHGSDVRVIYLSWSDVVDLMKAVSTEVVPRVKAWICWKHGVGMTLPAA
jgi:hypothetical protein